MIVGPFLVAIIVGYIIVVSVFIISENRSPQSTFAWLLLFGFLPGIGPLIYLFFGRSYHAFSRQNMLARQAIGSDLTYALGPLLARQQTMAERVAVERPSSFNRRLLNLVASNTGSLLTECNRVEILQNANEKYPRLLQDLRRARHSIHLEYYTWTNDDFTQQLKAVLIERVAEGVKVRCLYDAFTGKAMGEQYRLELRQGGIEIFPYLDYSSLSSLHNIQYRSHRKIAVIDGKIGYVGGMNLDSEQLDGPSGFTRWRDTHLRIHGEAALALQSSFVTSWYNTTREAITGPGYFPTEEIRQEVPDYLPVQVTQSGPDSRWSAIHQLYFFMIMAAGKRVYIQSPFFIPDDSISEALKAAALAGVDVRLMCQPRGSYYQLAYRAANTYYADMARAGVKIYLYQNDTYFHPKTINVDSSICSVGTANMDIRSFSINYEINAVLYDEEMARELEEDFMHDVQYCTEFSLEEYAARSFGYRFLDSVYRLASPLL